MTVSPTYTQASTHRLPFLGVAAGLVAVGLSLRLVDWGLPLRIHHSAGGFLWGGMVYALVAVCRPGGWRVRSVLLASMLIIAAVEGSRLVHAPELDSFRRTLAGQLLLGRVFDPWNVVVDGLGAALVAALTAGLLPHRRARQIRRVGRRASELGETASEERRGRGRGPHKINQGPSGP